MAPTGGSAAPDHLFVYGTLRAGFPAHHVLDGRARYEGFLPHAPAHSLFVRVRMDVETGDGERRPTWVYLFNRSTVGLARIRSGDYAARR